MVQTLAKVLRRQLLLTETFRALQTKVSQRANSLTGKRLLLSSLSLSLSLFVCPSHPLSHSLTHSPMHSFTHSLTHSLTHPLIQSLTFSLTFHWHPLYSCVYSVCKILHVCTMHLPYFYLKQMMTITCKLSLSLSLSLTPSLFHPNRR